MLAHTQVNTENRNIVKSEALLPYGVHTTGVKSTLIKAFMKKLRASLCSIFYSSFFNTSFCGAKKIYFSNTMHVGIPISILLIIKSRFLPEYSFK